MMTQRTLNRASRPIHRHSSLPLYRIPKHNMEKYTNYFHDIESFGCVTMGYIFMQQKKIFKINDPHTEVDALV